ncbi:hypothetical protein OXX79_000371 [Metschnikowia pulcherrima]
MSDIASDTRSTESLDPGKSQNTHTNGHMSATETAENHRSTSNSGLIIDCPAKRDRPNTSVTHDELPAPEPNTVHGGLQKIRTNSENVSLNESSGLSDATSDDEYLSSGDEALEGLEEESAAHHRHLTYNSGIAEHAAFFEKSLNEALDSVSLDSSLAMQARLSGQLNDKSQLLSEKQTEILTRLGKLKELYETYISKNKLGDLEKDIDQLTVRLRNLKNGQTKSTFFGKKTSSGVADKYPVEYNQARDKVLERLDS